MHVRLFSQMYISTQIRGGNMEEFFSHETLQYPPALARSGEMRSGNKSDLVKCIQPLSYTETVTNQECQLLFWKVLFPSFTLSPDVIKFRFRHMSPKVQLGKSGICSTMQPIFAALSHKPTFTQIQDAMPTIDRFTVLLYSRTSNCLTTNECRRELFCQGRSIDNTPTTTTAALWKHTFRSCYVAGHVWAQSMFKDQILPNPENWG